MSLSDTVGFIRDLPHKLVEAFEATLQEAADADLLLHVVDAASPLWLEQMRRGRARARARSAPRDVPQMLVFNKLDRSRAIAPPAAGGRLGRARERPARAAGLRQRARRRRARRAAPGAGRGRRRERLNAAAARPHLPLADRASSFLPTSGLPSTSHRPTPCPENHPERHAPGLADVCTRGRRHCCARCCACRIGLAARPRHAGADNGGRNDGPPDLDELWRDFNRKLSGLFGGKGGGRGPAATPTGRPTAGRRSSPT